MDIKLFPIGNGSSRFTFPALPEQIKGKSAAKYQSFDIISLGAVKVPKGTEVREVSWEGEFFGSPKRNEPIVRRDAWREPVECVNIINDFVQNGTILNLIVTETWINMDVTISSFQPIAYGAYGNIKYSISFVEKKPLEIYDTNELQIVAFVKKTKPRNEPDPAPAGSSYEVVSGDTLWGIAARKLGSGPKWPSIYDLNAGTIEAAAQAHGLNSSDHGHWIYPGTVLTLPAA